MWFSPPSEVDGEVFDGVVKDKKQAEEEFRMAVTRGRTAGTVVQRYMTHPHGHTHCSEVSDSMPLPVEGYRRYTNISVPYSHLPYSTIHYCSSLVYNS